MHRRVNHRPHDCDGLFRAISSCQSLVVSIRLGGHRLFIHFLSDCARIHSTIALAQWEAARCRNTILLISVSREEQNTVRTKIHAAPTCYSRVHLLHGIPVEVRPQMHVLTVLVHESSPSMLRCVYPALRSTRHDIDEKNIPTGPCLSDSVPQIDCCMKREAILIVKMPWV